MSSRERNLERKSGSDRKGGEGEIYKRLYLSDSTNTRLIAGTPRGWQ